MPATIVRQVVRKNLAIAVNAAVTDDIDMGGAERGAVFVPVGWDTADICFLGAMESNAYTPDKATDAPGVGIQPAPTFSLIRDETGTALRISGIVPGAWHLFPSRVLALKYFRLQSTLVGAVTPTNQSSARALTVVMKS